MTAVPHQATAVAIGGRGVMVEGPPGSGKSSLALALIDRGGHLIGDDGVLLEVRGDRLWALPPPNIAGLIEIRNVGLARMAAVEAPVALLLRLDEEAPRHVEVPDVVTLLGADLPTIALWPGSPVLALRAEAALALYGTV